MYNFSRALEVMSICRHPLGLKWRFHRRSTNRGKSSLRADSTDSLKRSEVSPPVESANQLHKVRLQSRVVSRLEEPNFIGGKRSLVFSFSLLDR